MPSISTQSDSTTQPPPTHPCKIFQSEGQEKKEVNRKESGWNVLTNCHLWQPVSLVDWLCLTWPGTASCLVCQNRWSTLGSWVVSLSFCTFYISKALGGRNVRLEREKIGVRKYSYFIQNVTLCIILQIYCLVYNYFYLLRKNAIKSNCL